MKKILILLLVSSLIKADSEKSKFDFSDIVKNTVKNRKEKINVIEIFKNEINNDGLTVVKFFATWCTPCTTYARHFKNVANELNEIKINNKNIPVKYIEIDCDDFATIAEFCSVKKLPMTVFYKNGKNINSIIGSMSSEELTKKITDLAR